MNTRSNEGSLGTFFTDEEKQNDPSRGLKSRRPISSTIINYRELAVAENSHRKPSRARVVVVESQGSVLFSSLSDKYVPDVQ